jgi:hypothetical protein
MPTFENQRRGSPNILGIPGKRFAAPRPNKGGQIVVGARPFRSPKGYLNMVLSGVSRDSAGAALGFCRVMIFATSDNSFVGETTSDASGNWSFSTATRGGPFFFVEYLIGAPDRFGTSLNTRTPQVFS